MKVLLKILVSCWILIAFSHVQASNPLSGTFVANSACDAFVSKNKRSNPDHAKLNIHQTYTLVEANKNKDPDWFRVNIESVSPPLRWVEASCGRTIFDEREQEGGGSVDLGKHASRHSPVLNATVRDAKGDRCHSAGHQDSYVLALSWQPAFCESHRTKPECRIKDKNAYQASHFTLHGLWPNQSSCGIHYEFCGSQRKIQGGFCAYPRLRLSKASRKRLEQVMPSAAQGSCLQRHEWYKHGTCQSNWQEDAYFDVAVNLTQQFNSVEISEFMSRHIGKRVSEKVFITVIDKVNGAGAHQSIELVCRRGLLSDVLIRLPATLSAGDRVADLMRQAETSMQAHRKFKSNCGGNFKIDAI